MTRKDFELIAKVLRERSPVSSANDTQFEYGRGYDYGRSSEWEAIAEHFADTLAAAHPRFVHSKFMAACYQKPPTL